jgi:hypothetical protein
MKGGSEAARSRSISSLTVCFGDLHRVRSKRGEVRKVGRVTALYTTSVLGEPVVS